MSNNQQIQHYGKARRILNAYGGYQARRRANFAQTAADLAPWSPPSAGFEAGYLEAERLRPARPPEIAADFLTPLFQALGVGFFAALVAGYIVMINDQVWHLSCFVSFVAAGLWYIGAIMAGRRTLWISESIYTGAADDPAPPAPSRPPIQLEVIQKDDRGRLASLQRFSDLPPDIQDRLPGFAAGVLGGRGLSQSAWTGKGSPFSRAEFDRLMDGLTQAGIVRWIDPNNRAQGRELTTGGRAALRKIASLANDGDYQDNRAVVGDLL